MGSLRLFGRQLTGFWEIMKGIKNEIMNRLADNYLVFIPNPGTAGRFFPGILACLVILGLLATLTAPTDARIVKDEEESSGSDPQQAFNLIATAWQNGDQQALADLVHETGLKVTSGATADRATHYSPSQAFYYFKNMFQTHRTLLFQFEKTQDTPAADRVHGMAVWKRRRPDSERIKELKLVCVLARQGDQWRLVEINKIR